MRAIVLTRTVLCIAALAVAAPAATALPRGVMSAHKDKYAGLDAPGAQFKCVSMSGSTIAIPAAFVNDNYCDCADGTDEPGTAACTYLGDRFPSELRFQCTNEGYAPQLFFHSRVNDGICDCCDGSDEYLPGGVQCRNTCAEAHAKAEQEREHREAARQAGLAARTALVEEAEKTQMGLKGKLMDHKATLATVDAEIEAAEKEKLEWEAKESEEREEIHRKSLAEKEKWDVEQAEKKKLREEEEAAKAAEAPPAAEPEVQTHTEPQGGVPPNVICTKWRQTGDCKGNGPRQPDSDKECDAVIESGASGFCECVDTRTGLDVEYPFDCTHQRLTCQKMCEAEGKEAGFLTGEPNNGGVATPPKEETFNVDTGSNHYKSEANEARTKYEDLRRKKREAETSVTDIESQLSGDAFGPDSAFLPLKGKCFDKQEGHYTYSLCPFDRVKQGYTNMGSWQSWGEQTYGAWGGKHDFAKMIYDNGDRCWNGPARSTEVRVICGPANELLSVDEPSMCTYKMVFQTPAICE